MSINKRNQAKVAPHSSHKNKKNRTAKKQNKNKRSNLAIHIESPIQTLTYPHACHKQRKYKNKQDKRIQTLKNNGNAYTVR